MERDAIDSTAEWDVERPFMIPTAAPFPHRTIKDPAADTPLMASGVGFTYDGTTPVVSDLNASFPIQGAFRVTAASGSGLSTTLRLLAGLLVPTSGRVTWGGVSVSAPDRMWDPKWRLALAYVQRTGGLLANQDLLSNACLPLVYHGWSSEENARSLAAEYFRATGITAESLRLPAWCSPTARKLCLLIRALLPQPRILIADEPLEGLCASGAESVVSLIDWHRREKNLLLLLLATEETAWDRKLALSLRTFSAGRFDGDSVWRP